MQLPVPVHIGSESPERWDDIEARQRQYGDSAGPGLRDRDRPGIADARLDWDVIGFEPRWLGFDTADCAAALAPSIYSGHGAHEFERFRWGAASRGEIALVVSPIGELGDTPQRSIFSTASSVSIGQSYTSVHGELIGKGARVRAAADLCDADGQLALRLLSSSPAPPWRSLSLGGSVLHNVVFGTQQHPPEGTLVPILETELGEPVVAAWISPDGVERRYVVPVETPWKLLLAWLIEQALPEFVPDAMRRARRSLAGDEGLMTRAERGAHTALAELEADYVARRSELEDQAEKAQEAASAIREGLLYGSGALLVDAVRAVLESVGVTVVDVDELLGDTKNADLLCTLGERSLLVEVKSASGSAPERAYQDLIRHLREWPSVKGSTPVEGGALVISHELRTPPLERSTRPYSRPEFLAAQREAVISVLELFDRWRDGDLDGIRTLLFADVGEEAVRSRDGTAGPAPEAAPAKQRRRWSRRYRRATGGADLEGRANGT